MGEIVGQSRDQMKDLQEGDQISFLINQRLNRHNDRISALEDTMRVNSVQERRLANAKRRNIVDILGGKQSKAYNDNRMRSKVFSAFHNNYKNSFQIPLIAEVPAKDFEAALDYSKDWTPDYDLRKEIAYLNAGQVIDE